MFKSSRWVTANCYTNNFISRCIPINKVNFKKKNLHSIFPFSSLDIVSGTTGWINNASRSDNKPRVSSTSFEDLWKIIRRKRTDGISLVIETFPAKILSFQSEYFEKEKERKRGRNLSGNAFKIWIGWLVWSDLMKRSLVETLRQKVRATLHLAASMVLKNHEEPRSSRDNTVWY